ncbi:hypothetical protein B0H13DRAFT_1882459 [Mycena leptocephala]|nr:hypothetical protein B0H13DRAFT_1882459 [Mycena leptocephala]
MRSPDVPPSLRLSSTAKISGLAVTWRMIVDNDGIVLKARIVGALKDIAFGGHKDIWVLQSAVGIEDIFPEETRALEGIVVNDSRDMPRVTLYLSLQCVTLTLTAAHGLSRQLVQPGDHFHRSQGVAQIQVKPKDQRPFTFGDIVNCEVEMRREDIEIPSGLNMSGFFKRVYRLKLTAVSHYLSKTSIHPANPVKNQTADILGDHPAASPGGRVDSDRFDVWLHHIGESDGVQYTDLGTRYWELAVPLTESGCAESALIESAFDAQRTHLLHLQGCNSPRDAAAYSFMRKRKIFLAVWTCLHSPKLGAYVRDGVTIGAEIHNIRKIICLLRRICIGANGSHEHWFWSKWRAVTGCFEQEWGGNGQRRAREGLQQDLGTRYKQGPTAWENFTEPDTTRGLVKLRHWAIGGGR